MSTSDPHNSGVTDDSPFRKRWFIMSAGFLVAIALIGVLVVLTTGGDNKPSAGGKDDPAPAASTPAASSSPADGSCPAFKGSSDAVPTTPPEDVSWTLFRAMALPSSPTGGPAVVEGDVARCYAHTPTGALLAATQISTRSTLARDWKHVMQEQTYGDARTTMIKAREKAEAASPAPDPEPGEFGQIAGFRFVTYDAHKAVIELVTRFTDPVTVLQTSTATVQWRDGDWRYEVSTTHANPKVVQSLAGYAEWGGV